LRGGLTPWPSLIRVNIHFRVLVYIPGEFGLRCEDDMVITADGPAQILSPSFQVSLEKPLG
jgi:Xaa-Pro aminopeptidase